MVQRKLIPNKLGIKHHHLKPDSNLRPSSPQTHDPKKIMKKPRPTRRSGEPTATLRTTPNKRPHPVHHHGPPAQPKQSPNYMKSTTSFEARKEPSPNKKPTPTASSNKSKIARTLIKTPTFKPSRPLKKRSSSVILCEGLDAQRSTCSSTLKESKFPSYLELIPGGTELDGTSAMKVCPYTYCSLNGHHHAPVPPLRCFLSSRRRAMKAHKSFKPVEKKNNEIVSKGAQKVDMKKENKDFCIEIYSKDLESDIDWEDGYGSVSCHDDEQTFKSQVESLYSELQESYDEESVGSGEWSESESDSSCHQHKDQGFLNDDVNDKMDDDDKIISIIEGCKNDGFKAKKDEDHNIKCSINYQQEEACPESEIVPDVAEDSHDGTDKHHHTIIYNIIQFNISVYVNGEKTEHKVDKCVSVQVPATDIVTDEMKTEKVKEAMVGTEASSMAEEQMMSDKDDDDDDDDDTHNLTAFNEASEMNQVVADEEGEHAVKQMDEEPASKSDEEQMPSTGQITSETNTESLFLCKERASIEEQQDPSINHNGSTRVKKPDQEMEDSMEFNPRGPNFLPQEPDPDAETVDLKHQAMDERKNAEEWMVDFALQQAVTTLAPARKRKVALLVEAFEKVMPIPKYEPHNRHTSKAFTNARPMQACS